MQILIWEIVEDGATSFDLAAGTFRLRSASVLNEANALWAMVISGQFDAVGINVFVAKGTQDLLVTPIPGAFSFLLSGIAGLSMASRKNKSVA